MQFSKTDPFKNQRQLASGSYKMKSPSGLRLAHRESVNSVFVNFEAGVVISLDENSIRIWDPVNGTELFETDMDDSDNSFIPGLSGNYRLEAACK